MISFQENNQSCKERNLILVSPTGSQSRHIPRKKIRTYRHTLVRFGLVTSRFILKRNSPLILGHLMLICFIFSRPMGASDRGILMHGSSHANVVLFWGLFLQHI